MAAQTQSVWRHFLAEDLAARRAQNPSFSLRSYARLLKLSPGHVSSILSGERSVTPKTAIHIAEALGVSPSETLSWLQAPSADDRHLTRVLSEEEFSPISEWYYYAIFGLANLKVNSAKPEWIARRLNIPLQIATQALKQLVSAGHIEISGGQFRKATRALRTKSDIPSSTIRRFHRQVLQLASTKLDGVPVERREFSHMTLAIDPKRLTAAKKMMREFVETFTTELDRGNKSSVYHLIVQFYPIAESK